MKLEHIIASKGEFVATVRPDATVRELVDALAEHRVGALVVSNDGRTIEGIVSERDVVRTLQSRGADVLAAPVSEIMTAQVQCAPPSATTEDLMGVMTEKRVRHVPVVDDEGKLLGIVSIGDVVKSRMGELEGEREALVQYITEGR